MVFISPIAGRSGGKAANGQSAEFPTTVANVRSLPRKDVRDLKTCWRDQNLSLALATRGAMSSEAVIPTLIGSPITSISEHATTLSPASILSSVGSKAADTYPR